MVLDVNGDIDDFNASNSTTKSFKFRTKITDQTGNSGTEMLKFRYH